MAGRPRGSLTLIALALLLQLIWPPTLGGTQPNFPSSTPQAESPAPKFSVTPADSAAGNHLDDLVASPGAVVSANAVVRNSGEVPIDLIVYVANVDTAVNGGPIFGALKDTSVELASWAAFTPLDISLAPGVEAAITVPIRVPDGVAPGQYVGGLVAETKESFAIPGTEVYSQIQRYAMRIGVLIPGAEVSGSMQLGEPSAAPGLLTIPMQNDGNYWLRPSGVMTIFTPAGEMLAEVELPLGIIFAGDDTEIVLGLPSQFPAGDYLLSVTVSDEVSGQSDSFEKVAITIPKPEDPRGLFVDEHAIEPNGDELVFANVEVLVRNGGDQIQAANVLLEVSHDGVVVEEFPLATNQVLISGENLLSARYLPADAWESGTYTFRVIVKSVEPNGGTEITLLEKELDAEIIVP